MVWLICERGCYDANIGVLALEERNDWFLEVDVEAHFIYALFHSKNYYLSITPPIQEQYFLLYPTELSSFVDSPASRVSFKRWEIIFGEIFGYEFKFKSRMQV